MAKRKAAKVESSERSAFDFYPTPDELALAIVHRIKSLYPNPARIIEPSAGSGAFVRAFRQEYPAKHITAVELRNEEMDNLKAAGAHEIHIRTWEEWVPYLPANSPHGITLVGGNFPFSLAAEHIKLGLDYLLPGSWIFSLLKDNFLGSYERLGCFGPPGDIWNHGQLKHIIPIVPRPSFKTTGKASNDTNEYSCFIWEVDWTGPSTILFPHIKWKEPRPRKRRDAWQSRSTE
jgi:hypothetical protein